MKQPLISSDFLSFFRSLSLTDLEESFSDRAAHYTAPFWLGNR
jgi:hypothetical protein